MSRTVRLLSAGLGFAIAAIYLVWSYTYEGRQQTMPVLIGWTAVVLTLVDIVAQTDTVVGRLLNTVLSGKPLDSSTVSDGTASVSIATVACLWLLGFVVLVGLIGFIAAIPLYTLGFMLVQGRMRWSTAFISAAAITLVTWLVFEKLLRYQVFQGVLFGGQL